MIADDGLEISVVSLHMLHLILGTAMLGEVLYPAIRPAIPTRP
jgi:hypothetical protein